MAEKRMNFYELDKNEYKANPVIEVLLYQLITLNQECPDNSDDKCKTWDIMSHSLVSMLTKHIFDTQPTAKEETNLMKMFVLINQNELPVVNATKILSNWRRLNAEELDNWINRKFVMC